MPSNMKDSGKGKGENSSSAATLVPKGNNKPSANTDTQLDGDKSRKKEKHRPVIKKTHLNASKYHKKENQKVAGDKIEAWRATMMATETKENLRWYLKQDEDEELELTLESDKPLGPHTVRSGEYWQAMLNLNGIKPGWYWVVLCVSLKDLNVDVLESIRFDAFTGNDEGETNLMDLLCTATLRKEDIQGLPKDGFSRLRLHRQIEVLKSDACLYPSVDIETTDGTKTSTSLELHYIELGSPDFKSSSGIKDHILYGDEAPDHFIRVGASCTEPISVSSFALSDTGIYAATIYLTNSKAHIQVWDLRTSDKEKSAPRKPQPLTLPYAQTSVDLPDGTSDFDANEYCDFNIAISGTGSKIALCSTFKSDSIPIPFKLFKCNPTAPVDHDLSEPWPLKESTEICQDIVGTFGQISFRTLNREEPSEQDERCFRFDGETLEIYSTHGMWNRVFSLSTKVDWQALDEMAEAIFDSVRDRRFVYTGVKGLVSVWDFESGKIISNIPVPEDTNVVEATLSVDGSMVAIAVSGTICVHDVFTGVRLGVLKEGLDESNLFQMNFGQDYFSTLDYGASTSGYDGQPNMRSVVRVSDMSVIKTYELCEDFDLYTQQPNGDAIFAYMQGAIVNIKSLSDISAIDVTCDNDCEQEEMEILTFDDGYEVDLVSNDDSTFLARSRDVYAPGGSVTILYIILEDSEGVVTDSATILLGSAKVYNFGFFEPATSRLFLITSDYLQVWKLSTTSTNLCELECIWKIHDEESKQEEDSKLCDLVSAKTCQHGTLLHMEVSPLKRFLNRLELETKFPRKENDILTFPMSPTDTTSTSEQFRLVKGVEYLVGTYARGDPSVKRAVIRYLKGCIRPSNNHPESCLVTLCRIWSPEEKTHLEALVADLLTTKGVSWFPDVDAAKDRNPLAILLKSAKTQPSVLGLVKIILDYCASSASRKKSLTFMAPVSACMHDLMEVCPVEAQDCLKRTAYIPAKQRAYIMDNHIIAHPPKIRMQFWNSEQKTLAETKNPILQMHESSSMSDPTNDGFTLPLFVAGFDALWDYKDNTTSISKEKVLARTIRPNGTTWWRTLYYLITLKFHLRTHTYVECHNFSLEFFDNPAIAALVGYKWNTIGFFYWVFRFFFQCIFYILVLTAALMQVYRGNLATSDLAGIFIAIIVFGAVFLWLELLQALKNWSRYSNIYNLLDMVAYTVPVAASIDQLVILYKNDATGNARILSFSVLAVFLHLLFELRINKSVCKYVTIIQETVAEIWVFFFIFAGGILAFTIATLHLLRGCPVLEGCKEPTTKFSDNFIGALSATYFFMGGRYDPVGDEFESDEWGFHIMMAVYFFFTVIIMLNVLIALINVAFSKGDESWRLVWIESRLRYIESAENLSYHIAGFRQSHNWFPKEIFYSATLEEVKAYRKKYMSNKSQSEDRDLLKDWGRDDDDDDDDTLLQGSPAVNRYDDNALTSSAPDETGNEPQYDDEEEEGEGEGEDGGGEWEDVDEDDDDEDNNGRNSNSAAVEYLKTQVTLLQSQLAQQLRTQQEAQDKAQRQLSAQLKTQQEMHEQSQRQLQELRELLLARK